MEQQRIVGLNRSVLLVVLLFPVIFKVFLSGRGEIGIRIVAFVLCLFPTWSGEEVDVRIIRQSVSPSVSHLSSE